MTKKKEAWASSLAEAKRNARIEITAPSGTRFTLRALTLDDLAAEDGLPQELLHIALLEMTPGGVVAEIANKLRKGDPESLEQSRILSANAAALRDRLVLRAVIEPSLKASDLAALDPFDKIEIADIAQRKKVVDAAGKQVGADALARFRAPGDEQ